MKNQSKTLVPEYLKNFQCIGADCEYTCCQKWTITVDKKTYKNYQKYKNRSFSPLADNNILPVKTHKNKFDYAIIKLKDDKFCPFLDDHQLCQIYQKLGANSMPLTCREYPRIYNLVNTDLEISLSMSCPEAVRIGLLNSNTMAFYHVDQSIDIQTKQAYNQIFTNSNEKKYFWPIRIASIDLLQRKDIRIITRLVLLGMLYKKVQVLIDAEQYDQIPKTLEDFLENAKSLDDSLLENLDQNWILQIRFVQHITKKEILKRNYHPQLNELLNNAEATVSPMGNERRESTDDEVKENTILHYQKLKQQILTPFLTNQAEHIIENYLVNEFFKRLMPFDGNKKIWESLIILSMDYFMIKTLLLGIANQKQSLEESDIVKVIYCFCRELIHNPHYQKFILDQLEYANLDTLGGLYSLIFD